MTFTDERIDEVRAGAPLTADERVWLLDDTPRFEECDLTREELAAMDDSQLMETALWVWTDYCR